MKTLLVLVPLLPFVGAYGATKQKGDRKNILFIAVDDMKPLMGCYGDKIAITPNMDALAADGALFTNAYCQQALSGPTRASLLTGLRPEEVGVTELSTPVRRKNPGVVTLPQLFRMNGYRTQSLGKVFHGAVNANDSASWSGQPLYVNYTKSDEYRLERNKTGKKADAMEVAPNPDSDYFDGRTTIKAIELVRELGQADVPFFLAVGYIKPHLPFCMPTKYWDMYDGVDMGVARADMGRPIDVPEIAYHNSDELRGYTDIPPLGEITPPQAAQLRRAYYACVTFVDAQIGMLINSLKEQGLYDNTVIVLFGDHGYHLGEQDLWCKSTNYEAACNAPLIIRNPSSKPHRSRDIVEFVDIYPTLTDACGVKPAGDLSGVSLLPVVNGHEGSKQYAVSQFPRPYASLHRASAREQMGYTIRDNRWRYVEWFDAKKNNLVATELYDMSQHKYEKVNIAADPKYKQTCEKLSGELHKILNNQKK